MIKDKQVANKLLRQMEAAHKYMMESLAVAKVECPQEEYRVYRSELSQIMGQLFFSVMEPIYRMHPDLAPSDTPADFFERWRDAE